MPQRRYGKFRVWIYTRNERGHRPHVHVYSGESKATIYIEGPVEVRRVAAMSSGDVSRAIRIVSEHADELLAIWYACNG